MESRIKQDKKQAGVELEMSRSQLVFNLVSLIHDGFVSFDDLEDFSDDLKGNINNFINIKGANNDRNKD